MIIVTDKSQVLEEKQYGVIFPSRAKRMFDRVVIDITYDCNLSCRNCNRLCGIFPRKNEMSLQSIRNFVDDSIRLGKKWMTIYISGGEPTLHPDMLEIYDILGGYIKYRREIGERDPEVVHATNGVSSRTRSLLSRLPDFVTEILNSEKNGPPMPFKPVTVAPIDLGLYDDDNLSSCTESWFCGICMNHRGFYPCAEAAAIDDVFLKQGIGVKKLENLSFKAMAEILHQTCRYCGYYLEPLGPVSREELMVSSSWEDKIPKKWRS